jgi:HD superfamily phosphohydrolase
MCEEGKIYSMKEELLRTFELRRAKWLYMSGSLHTVHSAATHTRLSHQIGSLIVGVNALREIDVYPYDDVIMSLGEYLLMRGDLHEFLMANFLHDIGHSPLSHVLEQNPFIELDHEEMTRNLIRGESTKEDEKMDWYVTERYLLEMKAIKDFEHRFFENKYDPLYVINYNKEGTFEDFRNNIEYNKSLLKSEIVTVSEVLDNFGVDKERVIEILTGNIFSFCP